VSNQTGTPCLGIPFQGVANTGVPIWGWRPLYFGPAFPPGGIKGVEKANPGNFRGLNLGTGMKPSGFPKKIPGLDWGSGFLDNPPVLVNPFPGVL